MKRTELRRKTPMKRGKSRSSSRSSGTKTGRMRRSSGTKRKPRSADEHVRIYGTPEHIAWMKAQSCAFCGIRGYSVVAHTRNGGMSKKADWEHTVPACENVPVHRYDSATESLVLMRVRPGCHHDFDHNKKSWREKYDTDGLAATYAASWRAEAAFRAQGGDSR